MFFSMFDNLRLAFRNPGKKGKKVASQRRSLGLCVEPLEERALMTIYNPILGIAVVEQGQPTMQQPVIPMGPSVPALTSANIIAQINQALQAPATANATLTGSSVTLGRITPTFGGTGYTTAPAVHFSGGGGTGASAHSVISNGVVTQIVVDKGGMNYTRPPTISIDAPTGFHDAALASFVLGVNQRLPNAQSYISGATVASGGKGYQKGDILTVQDGGGSAATLKVTGVDGNGAVTSVGVANGGSYGSNLPTLIGASLSGGHGSGATFNLNYNVNTNGYSVDSGATLNIPPLNSSNCVLSANVNTDGSVVFDLTISGVSGSLSVAIPQWLKNAGGAAVGAQLGSNGGLFGTIVGGVAGGALGGLLSDPSFNYTADVTAEFTLPTAAALLSGNGPGSGSVTLTANDIKLSGSNALGDVSQVFNAIAPFVPTSVTLTTTAAEQTQLDIEAAALSLGVTLLLKQAQTDGYNVNFTPRLNGISQIQFQFQPIVAFNEYTGNIEYYATLPSWVTKNGLTATVHDNADANGQMVINQIDLSKTHAELGFKGSGTQVSLNNQQIVFAPDTINQIGIATSNTKDNIQIQSLPASVTVYYDGGSGTNDSVTVGTPSNGLQGVAGVVDITASASLTVDDSADPIGRTATISKSAVSIQGLSTVYFTNLNSLNVKMMASDNVVNVEATNGTTTINDPAANGSVFVSPTANNLDNIGSLIINGSGSTALTIDDVAAPGKRQMTMYYTLNGNTLTRELVSSSSVPQPLQPPPKVLPPPAPTTITFHQLGSLTLAESNTGSQLDVDGTSAATTIDAGAAATINVDPNTQNLNNMNSMFTVQGTGSTVLQVFDQKNPGSAGQANPYTFNAGQLSMRKMNILYSNLHEVDLWAAHSTNNIQVLAAGSLSNGNVTALSVHAGTAKDQIAVTLPTAAGTLGAVSIDGAGAGLTLDGTETQNVWMPLASSSPPGFYAEVREHDVGITVSSQAVTYSDSVTDVSQAPAGSNGKPIDPKNPPPRPTKYTVTSSASQFGSTISYTNLANLVIKGGAVNTTYTVQSTAPTTPVTITAEAGTAYQAGVVNNNIFVTQSPTKNSFNVGYNGSVKNIQSKVTLNGQGASTVAVDDSKAPTTQADHVTVSNGPKNDVQVGLSGTQGQFFAAGGGLDCTGMSQLTLQLNNAAGDTATVAPNAVTALTIDGSATETGANMAALILNVMNGPSHAAGSGTISIAGFKPVTYSNMK
jgi:hypothetical protein